MEQQELRTRLAELRARFNRLKALCGLRNISRDTITSYAHEIARLNALLLTTPTHTTQLKGGTEQ